MPSDFEEGLRAAVKNGDVRAYLEGKYGDMVDAWTKRLDHKRMKKAVKVD